MLWIFLLFLLVLAGVIAYAGDVIGRRIGRKHYRLFGLRPKTTALIYAIGSGVLISLVSVLFFAALNQQALRNILEADSLRGEVRQLGKQVNPLRAEIKGTQTLLEGARVRLEAAQKQVSRLGARQKEILLDKSALEIEVSTLESVKNDLAIRTTQLEENSVQLEDRANTLQTQVLEAEQRVKQTNAKLEARGKALVEVQTQFRASRVQLERTQAQFQAGREQLRLSQQQLEERQAQLKESQAQLKSSAAQLKVSRQNLALSQGQLEALKTQKATLEREGTVLELAKVQLEAEKTRLSRTLTGERAEAAKVRATLGTLRASSSTLQSELTRQGGEVARLKKTRDSAQAELRKLGEQRAGFERDNGTLKSSIAQLKNERTQLQADLDRAGSELQAQRTGEFVYRKNDLVFQTTLERIDGPTLDAALQKALRRVSSRGAKGSLSSVLSADQKAALLTRMQALGGRSLLVLRSATNTIAGTFVTFQAEAVNNAVVFSRAQPIRSKLIAVGGEELRSNDDLRASLNALENTVLEALRGAGVPPENVLEGGLNEADTFELIGRLKTLGGSVLVGIAARDDVRPSSSVELYPIILR